jgi:hypothetical protein
MPVPPQPRSLRDWFARSETAVVELLIILVIAVLYSGPTLLDFDPGQLQQTGEHNESATLPLLAEIGLRRYGQVPLWNPYMLTGFPHAGDFVMHFWHPVATLPVIVWGGIVGMKVSVFLAYVLAGWGQWFFAQQAGLRGLFRLWAAVLFTISGGLAMLWQAGWYELLLGAAWFPWCFGALWWALRRRDRASIALASLCVAMVFTTGGGYYLVYLTVMLAALAALLALTAPAVERWLRVRRAIAVLVLGVGLSAVMLLPLVDGYRYAERDAGVDFDQIGSQPISYALINYIVSEPEWFHTTILGNQGGWNWFYIGWVPIAALALASLALRARRYRLPVIIVGLLALLILAWQAARYPPVKWIYELVPFMYTFRFPARLLVIATAPLIVLAGLGLQYIYIVAQAWGRRARVSLVSPQDDRPRPGISLRPVVTAAFVLLVFFSIRDVFAVNREWTFSSEPLNPDSFSALQFIKTQDPDLFYTNIGGVFPLWGWLPAAYSLEMPVINFRYNRRLHSWDRQFEEPSPFTADPRYLIALPDEPRPNSAEELRSFGDLSLWYVPDALPFAFSAPESLLQSGAPLTLDDVSALPARLAGPNRVVVEGNLPPGHRLVVLVSDYPGWRVSVDGLASTVQPVNGYLGAATAPGTHTFAFDFHPLSFDIGLAVSLISLVLAAGMVYLDSPLRSQLSR